MFFIDDLKHLIRKSYRVPMRLLPTKLSTYSHLISPLSEIPYVSSGNSEPTFQRPSLIIIIPIIFVPKSFPFHFYRVPCSTLLSQFRPHSRFQYVIRRFSNYSVKIHHLVRMCDPPARRANRLINCLE